MNSRRAFVVRAVILATVAAAVAAFGCASAPTRRVESFLEARERGVVRQAQEYSCGAASLATMAGLLGRATTEEEVLRAILTETFAARHGIDKDSGLPLLSAADLENAARSLGLRAVSLQADSGAAALEALDRLSPIIARVYLFENYKHFVVVLGVENGWVLIADPAYGRVRLPISRFAKVWERGDRVVLAYSLRPFQAARSEGGRLHLRRDPEEEIPAEPGIDPVSLYRSSLRSITMSNSVFRTD